MSARSKRVLATDADGHYCSPDALALAREVEALEKQRDAAFADLEKCRKQRSDYLRALEDEQDQHTCLRCGKSTGRRRNMSGDTWRGHAIEQIAPDVWAYVATGQLVRDNPDIDCGHCGKANTPEGHDACLGTLPGVVNACCGHGDPKAAYVQPEGGGE